jgi:RNase P protein component
LLPGLPGGFSAVFVARKAAAEAPYEALERAMRKVLVRAGFLQDMVR